MVVFILNLVYPGDGFHVVVPLQLFREFQKLSGCLSEKTGFSLRVFHIILLFQHFNLKEKKIHSLFQTFLKGFFSLCLNKFIRVLVGSQIYHPRADSRSTENRNSSESRFLSSFVTVIGEKHFLGIPTHKAGVAGSKSGSQRGYCIGKACLVHGNHIHISLTNNQIGLTGGSGHIQAVEISAFIKNLGFRRIQILRFSISHYPASEADNPIIYIHDGKHNPVPEFILHSPALLYVEQSGFL